VVFMRVRTVFTGVAGAPFYNNLYFDAPDTLAGAQGAVDLVDTAWTTLTSIMAGSLFGTTEADVPVIDIPSGQMIGSYATSPGVIDPTSAAEPLPWATQGLVRLSTADFINGRQVRGRIYVPGLTEASQSTGQPNSSTIASLANMAAVLVASTAADLFIYSRPHPDPDDPDVTIDGVASLVTGGSGWDQFAVLRSRRD